MNSRDPFGELKPHRALPSGLKQRFPDRVLVMTTDRCFGACPHCTRKFILGKSSVVDSPERLDACVDYVKRHPKVRDVLLSGGDVLTLPDAKVAKFVEAFARLGQVEVVRICTRAPVSSPARITARLARLLRRVGRGKVWAKHIETAKIDPETLGFYSFGEDGMHLEKTEPLRSMGDPENLKDLTQQVHAYSYHQK